MRGFRFVSLLFAITAAAPVAAQRPVDRNCSDDRGVDRCSEEQQRRTRQLFSVRSIEEHGAAGDQVRRVFYVDGYGRDVVLIALVRAPGRTRSSRFTSPDGRSMGQRRRCRPRCRWPSGTK